MFALTFTGNVTYGLSILLTSVEHKFLISKLPWLVGSLGTVAFDLTLIVQTLFYSRNGKKTIDDLDDGDSGDTVSLVSSSINDT